MKPTLYFIPGLGGDKSMFAYPLMGVYPYNIIEWLTPTSFKESLVSYARRMAQAIDTSQPFILIGVSLGGIVSQEITKLFQQQGVTTLQKTILISSVKTKQEIPPIIRLGQRLPIYKLFSPTIFELSTRFTQPFLEQRSPNYGEQLHNMWAASHPSFLKWGMHQVVHWDHAEPLANIVQIHGSKDLTFPIRYLKNVDEVIPNGSHFMSVDRPTAVNTALLKYL